MSQVLIRDKVKAFVLIFLYFLLINLILSILSDNFFLKWPSHVILPAILNNNSGILEHDFYTSNITNTPQEILINLYSLILPISQDKVLSFFSLIQLYLRSFAITSTIFIITSLFFGFKNNNLYKKSTLGFNATFICISLFYTVIYSITSASVFRFTGNIGSIIGWSNFATYIFFKIPFEGITTAGVSFPLNLISARALSFFLSFSSIIAPLICDIYSHKLKRGITLILLSSFLLNFLSALLHPVSPIAVLLIITIYLYVKRNYFFFILLLTNITSYLLAIKYLIDRFPQENINNLDLYEIYVNLRHPLHYLPSYYLSSKFFLLGLLINIFVISIIFFTNKLILKNKILHKLIFSSIISFFIINLIQYIFVEYLKLKVFIKLGISAIIFVSNIFYTLSILYFIYLLAEKYNVFIKFETQLKRIKLFTLKISNIKLLYPAISLLIILSSIVINLNYEKIEKSYSRKLGIFINNNIVNEKTEFIFDDDIQNIFIFPREIGGINIYNDQYFPFNSSSLKEWQKRNLLVSKLKKCINSKSLECKLKNVNNVFYINKNIENSLSDNFKIFTLNEEKFYIQEIETF